MTILAQLIQYFLLLLRIELKVSQRCQEEFGKEKKEKSSDWHRLIKVEGVVGETYWAQKKDFWLTNLFQQKE